MGRYEEAVEQARKATAVDPTQVTAYMAAGRALSLQGRHADAVAVLQEADRRSAGDIFQPPGSAAPTFTLSSVTRLFASCRKTSKVLPGKVLKTVNGCCSTHASVTKTAHSITWKKCMPSVIRFFPFG